MGQRAPDSLPRTSNYSCSGRSRNEIAEAGDKLHFDKLCARNQRKCGPNPYLLASVRQTASMIYCGVDRSGGNVSRGNYFFLSCPASLLTTLSGASHNLITPTEARSSARVSSSSSAELPRRLSFAPAVPGGAQAEQHSRNQSSHQSIDESV